MRCKKLTKNELNNLNWLWIVACSDVMDSYIDPYFKARFEILSEFDQFIIELERQNQCQQ